MTALNTEIIPVWDTEKLFGFKGVEDTAYDEAIEALTKRMRSFHADFYGELKTKLVLSVVEYNQLVECMADLQTYIRAVLDVNCSDSNTKRGSYLEAQIDEVQSECMSFWTIEVCSLEDSNVEEQLKAAGDTLSESFRRYIKRIRILKPHMLPEEVEIALSSREPYCGTRPVTDFLTRCLTKLKFQWVNPVTKKEQTLGLEETLQLLRDHDWKVRHAALKCLNDRLGSPDAAGMATLALDMVAGEGYIDQKSRKYNSLRHRQCLANQTSEAVVEAILKAVKTRGSVWGKRFYRLKKAILKKTKDLPEFTWADRIAEIVLEGTTQPVIQYDEAVKIVRESFEAFSPEIASHFDRLVEEGRIDALVRPNKRGNAYCMLGSEKSGPFVMMNYLGKMDDVCTLAHESGHAIHAIHSTQTQPYVQSVPGSAIAETASTFGEEMVFMNLLSHCKTPQDKLLRLMTKCDDILGTSVRQTCLDRFEELFHTARKDGTVSEEDLKGFWVQCTKEFYGEEGEVFDKFDDMSHSWVYIPHFTMYPFYVHSYTIAGLITGGLYKVYCDKKLPDFAKTYAEFLSSGASMQLAEQLKLFGLDGNDPAFWEETIDCYLGNMIIKAEEVAAELGFKPAE